ncbi:MAG: UDP-N-acetylglucosamine 2-epimerase [Planctomycetota bacterium]|jgi:GDP/UDP-N,N'-diacetylbacillosamine 2-epimerase (hydrolysing)
MYGKKALKKVAVFTTTRAEFGILLPLIRAMKRSQGIIPLVFAGGTHLAPEHGQTIKEIEETGAKITDTFDYLLNQSDSFSLGKSVGIATYELSHVFRDHDFDLVCIAGDRFELLSIVSNSILFKKPIIHIHGGERTEGAIDESIRHMITKAAHLHFVSCQEHGENIRKMGEPGWRIHNVGALGIDSAIAATKKPKTQLFKKMGLNIGKAMVLMTYHPVSLEFTVSSEEQISNVINALKSYDLQVVITAPNIEVGRDKIISIIKDEVDKNPDMHFFDSLGTKNYLSLLSHCEFVIGNSSSGILETPSFRIPTVNIGDRQKGRVRHKSILDTDYSVESIKTGIERALTDEFRNSLKDMAFKFGDGNAAERIVKAIKETKIDQVLMRKKLEFSN